MPGVDVDLVVEETCPEPGHYLSVEIKATTPQGLSGRLLVDLFPPGAGQAGQPARSWEIPLPTARDVRSRSLTIVS